MDVYDVLECVMHSSGSASGTAVQKLAYIASEKIPHLDMPEHALQYFGPYSQEVNAAFVKLVSYLFVSERTIPGAGLVYELTDDGRKITGIASATHHTSYAGITDLVGTCRDACGLDPLSLCLASTVMFTQKKYSPEICRGWGMNAGQIDGAKRLLEVLN